MKQGQFPAVLPLASLNGQNGFKIDGENFGDSSGVSVSAAGDVNGDGYFDFLIGAMGHNGNTGRSYVIFGGTDIGIEGEILLSSLNGSTGFKLDGEVGGDYSGQAVSSAGDVNNDGHPDILIGAFLHASGVGRSYLIFGGPEMGRSGVLSLASLNGTNGFIMDGELTGDQNGIAVSSVGDFDGDGRMDFATASFGYPSASYNGRNYVLFGSSSLNSTGLVKLTSLNGITGIKFDGSSGDYSGNWIAGNMDINGDSRDDLLISAPYGSSNKGCSYVVFGRQKDGVSNFLLSNLNGTNGFKLDGEASGDLSGFPITNAGDVNGDGYDDLLIGAYSHANYTGRSYVVFGNPSIIGASIFQLANLNGSNGFKIDAEKPGDYSGRSLSSAGDFNGDGYADLLIESDSYANKTGRSYIIFGDPRIGKSGIISLANINGVNGFKLDGEAVGDQSGYRGSTIGDINGDGVSDILIGAYGHNNSAGRSYVVFGDAPPVLVNNSLSLSSGAAITLNASNLGATDRNHNNNTLVFIPNGVVHGQFESISNPGVPLVNFTQQQITSGAIQFVHDGTLVPPSYNITVRSTGIAWVGPVPAQINFIGAPQSHFPAIIPLAGLNGQNGFKIDGENPGDYSGQWVGLGDINADGYIDLLIGALGFNNYAGRSYVLFGKPGLGSSGLISLSNINGTINCFKFDGESGSYQSGISLNMGGDVNGDGYADLLIGAYSAIPGRSYLFFGGPQVGNGSIFSLSNLNGGNGFKILGEATTDRSGYPVSIGDINGDEVADLIVGAIGYNSNTGRNYVVFGGSGIGSSGSISLSTLNGVNGFKIDGEAVNDILNGGSLSPVGDINGDGHTDLIMGVDNYNNTGRSYVVFGGPGIGSGGLIWLSALNGFNGFKLEAEAINDGCGWSTAAAGDINADGCDDLIIGCAGHHNGTGRSHVVFGEPNIGASGLLSLSQLNGTNGFKIDGETTGDNSGHSVHTVGDVNGDGYDDLSIGAHNYNNSIGRSYIVFGGPGVGESGLLLLSDVNGDNGFKLDGETAGDFLNYATSSAGDINGDGITDLLVSADGHASSTGRSYVLFGDAPPVLVNNKLQLSFGATIVLNSTFLTAYDLNHNNNSLIFISTAVAHGQFEFVGQPGVALSNFTQSQLLNKTVQFVHDGSAFAPSYNMTVRSDGIAWTGPSVANITFIPTVTTTVVSTLATTQTLTPTPSVSGTATPSPSLSPTPVFGTPTSIVTPTPTPVSVFPVLLNNQLMLSNGQTVVLSSNNLQAGEIGFNNSQLIFIVSNVQNGYFATVPSNSGTSKNLTSFTQAQIQNGAVEFVHKGNKQAPSYSVLASDGVQSTVPSVATIDFIGAPIITQNSVNVTTGSIITLTSAMLNVTAPSGVTASQISLTVTDLQHATITSTLTQASISNFTLAEVEAGDIQLTPDGNLITPSYTITATVISTGLSSAPNAAAVLFCNSGVCAPQLVNNYLEVTQGKATLLSDRYLSAKQPYGSLLGNSTVYYISDTTHGHFSLIAQPQTWISFFNQDQLSGGQVQFVQDGSLSTPGYSSAVRAFGLQSASQPAGIYFTVLNEPSSTPTPSAIESGYSTIQKAIIGASISGGMGIGFALVQICLKRVANRKLLQALGEGANDYDQNVVRPVAQEIASRVKITGFLNATTNIRMRSFKSAVRSLLSALSARGVDLDFKKMRAPERDALINEIGNQTYRWVKSKRRGCTACCPGFSSFFKPQIVPENLQDAAGEIADNVVQALSRNRSQVRMSQHLSVSGSPVFAEPSGKRSVEMDEISSVSQKGNDMKEELIENPSVVQLG